MQILLLILLFSSLANGFLLESQNSNGHTGSNNQYLTVTEFFDAKAQLQNGMDALHHEMEQLRHDTSKMLNVLAGQVQDKLTTFAKETEQTRNGSQTHVCEQNEELLNNYTKLRQNLETVTQNFSLLAKEFIKLTNKSNDLSRELQDLKQLKNIHALQDISALQQKVQSISSQTHSLSVNERARTQDFLALYNVTIESRQAISNMETITNKSIKDLNRTIHALEISQNVKLDTKVQSVSTVVNKTAENFANNLDEIEKTMNSTFVKMENQISINAERVALTACVESPEFGSLSNGHIVKFADIRTNIGVNSVSSFKSNGKFICESKGLYLITASLLSQTALSSFGIFKNGSLITHGSITNDNRSKYYSSTTVAAVDLQTNDNIWVQIHPNSMVISEFYQHDLCLTVVKLK